MSDNLPFWIKELARMRSELTNAVKDKHNEHRREKAEHTADERA